MNTLEFYRGRRVLVTGFTGFKGTWLCTVLNLAGAEVAGYALPPAEEPNLYSLCGAGEFLRPVYGDVRDLDAMKRLFAEFRPEVVFHLAAQPIVREGYRDPVGTYGTNVMGTVHLMECVRKTDTVRSVLNVTTDKVYHNREWIWGYRENEELNGYDPYSNSKSCSELVTDCYKNSYFQDGPAVSTARAGNVIGGGDYAKDRIIPDCVRAAVHGEPVRLRNPNSVRPYQHVLEPLFAYLMIAAAQWEAPEYSGAYNVGPDDCDCITTGRLAALFCRYWGGGMSWECAEPNGPHEANFLKLDCAKLKQAFQWNPVWRVDRAVERTVAWYRDQTAGGDAALCMERQIREYIEEQERQHV